MNLYDFKELNDEEFEELAKDLLSLDLQINLKTYKKGRDESVDLSNGFTLNRKNIIGQIKHYPNSKFSNLKSSLKKEVPNITKLNPKRYILVTSLDLSVKQCNELTELLDPYLKTHDNIYDKKRLNEILSQKGSDIEKKYFKL